MEKPPYVRTCNIEQLQPSQIFISKLFDTLGSKVIATMRDTVHITQMLRSKLFSHLEGLTALESSLSSEFYMLLIM